MPKYDSLLLNCGGGIINRSQQSKQYRGAAALAIGIGGTGVVTGVPAGAGSLAAASYQAGAKVRFRYPPTGTALTNHVPVKSTVSASAWAQASAGLPERLASWKTGVASPPL